MELVEKDITDLDSYFGLTAKNNGLEKDVIIASFKEAYAVVAKNPAAQNTNKRGMIRRAKSQLTRILDNMEKEGEPFVVIINGIDGRPKDWNLNEFKYREEKYEEGKLNTLVREGKVMTMDVEGKQVPVTSIDTYKIVKRVVEISTGDFVEMDLTKAKANKKKYAILNEFVILTGNVWAPGNIAPLWRDSERILDYANKGNWKWSQKLEHSYRLTLVGEGYPEKKSDDVRMLVINLYGDQANPDSKDYFFNHFTSFKPYAANFVVDTTKTTATQYVLRTKKLVPKKAQITGEIEDIIESTIIMLQKKYPKDESIPGFFDDPYSLEEYHEKNKSLKKDGSVYKSKGREYLAWGKYIILIADISSMSEPKAGNKPIFKLSSGLLNSKMTAYSGDAITSFPENGKIPGQYLLMGTTRREKDRWDPRLNKRVPTDNNEITFTINGMKLLYTSDEDADEIKPIKGVEV